MGYWLCQSILSGFVNYLPRCLYLPNLFTKVFYFVILNVFSDFSSIKLTLINFAASIKSGVVNTSTYPKSVCYHCDYDHNRIV